jgi:uncharacterized membrane protein YeaQ/YmgE (transglycosylase-associated protein family)
MSAFLIGVLGLFVGGWATAAFNIDGMSSMAIAIGFIGLATVVLIPRAKPQRCQRPMREHNRS